MDTASTFSVSSLYVPAGLIGLGLVTNRSPLKEDLQQSLHGFPGRTYTHVDDFLQYVPTAAFMGYLIINGETSIGRSQVGHYLISVGSTLGLTYALKEWTEVRRPKGGSRSFPSGHTAFAFSSATVTYHLVRDQYPFWAWMSYVPAGATAVLRVLNDDHWVPDVLMGAGLGILVSHLTYIIWPVKKEKSHTKNALSNLHFDIRGASVSLAYRW